MGDNESVAGREEARSLDPIAQRDEAAIRPTSLQSQGPSLATHDNPESAFAQFRDHEAWAPAGTASQQAAPGHHSIESQRQRSMQLRAEGRSTAMPTQDETNILHIPPDFAAKEGVKLTEGLFVGKHISSGLQGGVYDLVDKDGVPVDVVVKVVHRHALLAEVEREWEVGTRLGFLAEPDGTLPGFMGTGSALRDSNGRFRGMILERLHGRCVDKVICTKSFADVRYVHDMLKCVFTALERAQSWLGFHHSDLRLANVMEILTNTGAEGNGSIPPREETKSEHTLGEEQKKEQSASGASQKRVKYQFKVIDYGLANFEETYACGPDLYVDEKSQTGAGDELNVQQSQPSTPGPGGCMVPIMLQRDDVDRLPSTSPIEKLYRYMWRRKGDVYHLLFNLGEWLDGRIWPDRDELDVLRLLDLIHHVTGSRLKAYFCGSENPSDCGQSGWQDIATCGLFNRQGASLHFLRRWHVRLAGWTHPSNPGLTAAEALTAPFFTKHRSLRTVITGASTRYAAWTKPSQRHRRSRSRRVPSSRRMSGDAQS